MAAAGVKATIKQVKGSHLIEQSLSDELVIFDKETNKAHMLDARAAAIYRAAEKGCSIDDVMAVVEGGTDAEKRAAAQLGIQDLETAGLVMSSLPRMPRRGLLKTLGVAAALPMVISIMAPSPAAAASNLARGVTCSTGDTCLSGATCQTATGSPSPRCCISSGNATSDTDCSGTGTGANSTGNAVSSLSCCSGLCGAGVCV